MLYQLSHARRVKPILHRVSGQSAAGAPEAAFSPIRRWKLGYGRKLDFLDRLDHQLGNLVSSLDIDR